MPAIRGITISVGQWYADLLRITLPANMRHLTECLIVTEPGDPSIEVARSVPGARVFETAAFRDFGARFNKGLAMEQGFDFMGKHGWIFIFDADIILPDSLPVDRLDPRKIHGMPRRILDDPKQWHPGFDWKLAKKNFDGSPIGYAQLFHTDAPALEGKRPWYDVSFPHAGGGDAYFLTHFAGGDRVMMRAECLHLGKVDVHWHGCDPEGIDLQAKYVTYNGWHRAIKNHTPESAARAGELPGRIQVPGYPPSTFELPFERRAAEKRAREARARPQRTP